MKVINTQDHDITIQVKGGTKYTVLANDVLFGVPTEHAEFWKGLHPFLGFEEESSDTISEVKEIVDEVVEEVKEEQLEVEEVVEEVEVEEPKKKKSKK